MRRVEDSDPERLEQRSQKCHVCRSDGLVPRVEPLEQLDRTAVDRWPRRSRQRLHLRREIAKRHRRHRASQWFQVVHAQELRAAGGCHDRAARLFEIGVVGGRPENRGDRNACRALQRVRQRPRTEGLRKSVNRPAEQSGLLAGCDDDATTGGRCLQASLCFSGSVKRRC